MTGTETDGVRALDGPLAQALKAEVEEALRQYGVVVWLDPHAHYTGFVDRLAALRETGELAYPVVPFRGSYLEMMLALEPYGSELYPERLLIHMPGHSEASIRKTPLLELYELGFRFRKALSTLVEQAATGILAPADVRELVSQSELSLESAEGFLEERVGQRSEGLDATLARLELGQVAESVLGGTGLVRSLRSAADFSALQSYLHRQTGYDAQWAESVLPASPRDEVDPIAAWPEVLRRRFGAWLLLLEFVHDLTRPPRSAQLVHLLTVPKELVRRCHELVVSMRARSAESYEHLSEELSTLVDDERHDVRPEDLGRIDTFAFEEHVVLRGAIAALGRGEWAPVQEWARDRAGDGSFWLSRDRRRRWAWMLAEQAAELGVAIDTRPRPLEGARTLEDAVDRYRQEAFRVDRAHRLFEQRWHSLRGPELPHHADLLDVVERVRRRYRAWADQLARDFTAICEEHGYLPDSSLQQRALFDDVVRPLAQEPEPMALFLLDALRFEMAEALAEELRGTGGVTVDLRARLAELPTLTAVGMNALAPVARDGKLAPVMTGTGGFRGFKTGSFAVNDPATRARAMGERAIGEGARLVKLAEVVDASSKRLREWVTKGPRLIVVHGLEIDDAGEAGFGLPTFEDTLRQVRAAWHHLSAAGVKTFVFTADHGFLLQDSTATVQPYGKKTDPSRRYAWHAEAVREEGMVPVSLAKLGYEGAEGYLLLREDTAVYATKSAGSTFVHGGNSLEERVIPVLVVKRRRGPGQSSSTYVVEAKAEKPTRGTQRIALRVQLAAQVTGSLGFAGAQTIRLAVGALDRKDVQVRVRDTTEPALLRAGVLEVPVGAEWSEVFFVLEGPSDERVRVTVFHPDGIENVQAAVLEEFFGVAGTVTTSSSEPPPAKAAVLGWQDAIEDEDFRRVFAHIEKHSSLSEAELQQMIGARKGRAFARQYDSLVARLPFRVSIEVLAGAQKVYRKDGGR